MRRRFDRISGLPVTFAVLDRFGVIVGVNERWKRFARDNGFVLPDFGIGQNYLAIATAGLGPEHEFVKCLGSLLEGSVAHLSWVYPCHTPREERWFAVIGLPAAEGPARSTILLHVDLTEFAGRGLASMYPTGAGFPTRGNALERGAAAQPHEAGPTQSELHDLRWWRVSTLTSRERAVLECLVRGLSNGEIAAELRTSTGTVKVHIRNLLRKLGVNSRAKAAAAAMQLRDQS